MSFREINDYELDRLSDERLIAYVAAARKAGALDAARLGMSVFTHRRWDQLVARAARRMPTSHDAEEVVADTLRDVFKASFDGEVVGEAVRFVQRILARRIADWYERRKETVPLPEENPDENARPHAATTDDESGKVIVASVAAQVYAALESDYHRMVVDDYVFAKYGAKETAARVNTSYPQLNTPMSDQNVHQIASRFRETLRGELGLS